MMIIKKICFFKVIEIKTSSIFVNRIITKKYEISNERSLER